MNDPNESCSVEQADQATTLPRTESHVRSMLKAFSWRIVATTTTTTIAYGMTGQVRTALSIGGIEFFIKFFIYYAHERAWQLVPRGAVRSLFREK